MRAGLFILLAVVLLLMVLAAVGYVELLRRSKAAVAPVRPVRGAFWLVDSGIFLYLVLDIIAQSLPPHYSPISQAESFLAVGPYGYIMTVNFLNRGLLSLAFIYAFVRTLHVGGIDCSKYRVGLYLLGLWGVGALLLAAFPTDAPGAPATLHSVIHLVVASLAFLGGTVGVFLLSRRLKENPALRGIAGVAMAIAVIAVVSFVLLYGLPFIVPHFAARIGGVTERLLIASVLVWMLVLSVRLGKKEVMAKQ
jgi:hypothetical protein